MGERNQTGQTTIKGLKADYRSGGDNLVDDFFSPCLSACSRYRRAAGYFSSTALAAWMGALDRLGAEVEIVFQVIASPQLSSMDIQALREATDPDKKKTAREQIIDRLITEISSEVSGESAESAYAKLFAWLIANDYLEIKFAFPRHIDSPGIFHEKIGIFDFPGGDQVAFTGSANETWGGHQRNYESIDVYRSWLESEKGRVDNKIAQFDEAWTDSAEGLSVEPLTTATIEKLKSVAPSQKPAPPPRPQKPSLPKPARQFELWRHQAEAVESFLEKKAGILEMATGTGKTRAALSIIERLVQSNRVDSAVITVNGTDLLAQWEGDLIDDGYAQNLPGGFLVYRHFGDFHEMAEFAVDSRGSILVISRLQLEKLFQLFPAEKRSKTILVHDEVHGMGIPGLRKATHGEHRVFPYRLGLSATPDRAYDAEGNQFIENELGPTIYKYPIESAIRDGILCEFDYVPLHYDLTEDDRERISGVYARKAARAREGKPMTKEEVWIALSAVYKTAEMKPEIFRNYLSKSPSVIEQCIIFVETREYADRVLDDIHFRTMDYHTYFAADDQQNLEDFSAGDLDCLITCHKLSQGIDIRKLQNVVLFSSARAKLETIQRIGRCLRIDPDNPGKRARIIDFVRPSEEGEKILNADQDRKKWLTDLSQIRREDKNGS